MKKLLTGIGSLFVALCVITACKDKQTENVNQAKEEATSATEAAHQGVDAKAHEHKDKANHDHGDKAEKHAHHIKIEDAKIPATTVDTAAVFMKIHNNGHDDKLVRASAEGVKTVELHQTILENNIAKMQAVKEIDVAAGKTATLEHGGMHIMLIGLPHGGLQEGHKVKMTLVFEKAGEVTVDVPVVAAGDAHHHTH